MLMRPSLAGGASSIMTTTSSLPAESSAESEAQSGGSHSTSPPISTNNNHHHTSFVTSGSHHHPDSVNDDDGAIGDAGHPAEDVLVSVPSVNGKTTPLSSSASSCQDQPDTDTIKMFVGQVPRSMDEHQLRVMFEEFGPVYQINVLRDKSSGQSKGCCFVTFYTRKAALDAQNALHNVKTLPGMHHPIQMKPADTENRNERKLFVGMVSKKLNENDVRQMFSHFGTIEECTILRDTIGVSKGCAFVTFSSRQCAITAIKAMHHSQTMEGCSSPLVVKFADTQKDKEQKKVQQLQTNLWSFAGISTPQSTSSSIPSAYLTAIPQLSGGLNGLTATGPAVANLAGTGLSSGAGVNLNLLTLQQLLSAAPMAMVNGSHATDNLATLQAFHSGSLGQLLTSNPAFSTLALPGLPATHGGLQMALNVPVSAASLMSVESENVASNSHHSGIPSLLTSVPAATGSTSSAASGATTVLVPGCSASSSSTSPSTAATLAALQAVAASGGASATTTSMAQNSGPKQHGGPDGANLFIYHLPQEFSDSDLYQTFQPFGSIISAKVYVDKITNLSKCFGFVSYDNAVSAQAAIQAMNGFHVGTKRLKVQLKRIRETGRPY